MSSGNSEDAKRSSTSWASVCAEASTIVRLALPMCIQAISWAMQPMTMLFVSRYGTDVIAGAGLGYMWTAVTGESLIYGSGMGLATLSSQAFGAKNYRRVGVLWQRQCVYQWILCILTGTLWWNTEAIMLSLGQPPRVAANAAVWCRWQLHGLPAVPVLNSLNVFLGSQRIVRPAAIISTATTFAITIPAIYLFTQPERMGFKGAPFAIAGGQLLQAAALRIVAPRVIKHPTWIPWSVAALQGWWELIRLGVGGAVGLWAEWWAAELMIFLAGILCSVNLDPDDACAAVAVTVLLRNFGNSAIGFSWGFCTAGCTRVGNLLGENKPWEARVAALLGGGMQVIVALVLGVLIVSFVDTWSRWFDLDEVSVKLLQKLIPLGMFYWLGIALGCGALRSILTAMGLVRFAAIVQLVAFCECTSAHATRFCLQRISQTLIGLSNLLTAACSTAGPCLSLCPCVPLSFCLSTRPNWYGAWSGSGI